MPALNFQSRFTARVSDGSKHHTIRRGRKRAFRQGDTLSFFTGMRTKQCCRLRSNAFCKAAIPIELDSLRGVVVLEGVRLSDGEVDLLARKDGYEQTQEFWDFFRRTHGDILRGQRLEWSP